MNDVLIAYQFTLLKSYCIFYDIVILSCIKELHKLIKKKSQHSI